MLAGMGACAGDRGVMVPVGGPRGRDYGRGRGHDGAALDGAVVEASLQDQSPIGIGRFDDVALAEKLFYPVRIVQVALIVPDPEPPEGDGQDEDDGDRGNPHAHAVRHCGMADGCSRPAL